MTAASRTQRTCIIMREILWVLQHRWPTKLVTLMLSCKLFTNFNSAPAGIHADFHRILGEEQTHSKADWMQIQILIFDFQLSPEVEKIRVRWPKAELGEKDFAPPQVWIPEGQAVFLQMMGIRDRAWTTGPLAFFRLVTSNFRRGIWVRSCKHRIHFAVVCQLHHHFWHYFNLMTGLTRCIRIPCAADSH